MPLGGGGGGGNVKSKIRVVALYLSSFWTCSAVMEEE